MYNYHKTQFIHLYIVYIIWLITGLSPDLQSMEQIRRIMRPTDVPDTGKHAQTQSLHEYLYNIV